MLLKLIDHLKNQNVLTHEYKGIVVDNADPKKLGRVKCKVDYVFEDADPARLPWCFPRGNSTLGGRVDLSNFAVPEIQSELTIIFPYEDWYYPVYVGFWQNSPTTHQGTLLDEDYPESYGHINSEISWFKLNKAQNYMETYHVSNTYVQVDKEGNVWITNPKDVVWNVGEDFHLNIGKDLNINVGRDINTKCVRNYAENIGKDHGVKIVMNKTTEVGQSIGEKAGMDIKRDAGMNHEIVAGMNQGIKAGAWITHFAPKIDHNLPAELALMAPALAVVDAGIADLEGQMEVLKARLDAMKAQSDAIKAERDPIKEALKAQADALVGRP
jgi:hypothetical protein